jgi:hypothetical protein
MDGGKPSTLDESARSVEVAMATEEPVLVFDWDNWQTVHEVLLMSGCRIPEGGRVPLLDSHSRFRVADVIGSCLDLRVETGPEGSTLAGRMVFSATPDGETPFRKVVEGHVTDVSIGYEVAAHISLKEHESTVVDGKTFAGPMRIGTDWTLRELSLCPIGADPNAKVRAGNHTSASAAGQNKEMSMPKRAAGGKKAAKIDEKRAGLVARLRKLLGLRAEEDEADEEERDDVEIIAGASDADLSAAMDEVFGEGRSEEEEDEEDNPDDEDKGERKAGRKRVRAALRSLLIARSAGGRAGADTLRDALRAAFPPPDPAVMAVRDERARISSIRALAREFNVAPEAEEKLITSGASLDLAKAQVLDMVSGRRDAGPGFHVSQGRTEMEKFGSALRDSLFLRTGARLLKHEPGSAEYGREKPAERALRDAAPGAADLLSLPMPMLCRELLSRAGERVSGDPRSMVGRALTTTDLPNLLVETSHRILLDAFDSAPETWPIWAPKAQVADFKKTKAIGFEGDVHLLIKPEGGEYMEGKLSETAEEFFVQTFGRKMSISREALINDDLNALSRMPALYGYAAAELVGDVAYKGLLAAPVMGDGNALFGTAHRNLYAGKGGAPTVPNLGAVVTGMKLQKDAFGKTISILPQFFIAPVGLEVASEQFFNTQLQGAGAIVGTQPAPLVNNPYGGAYFTRVYDRRLDDDDPSAWYLAARDGTVVVFFLGGIEAPYIESQPNFDTDGVESKVRMDVGAKAVRYVTLAKATA